MMAPRSSLVATFLLAAALFDSASAMRKIANTDAEGTASAARTDADLERPRKPRRDPRWCASSVSSPCSKIQQKQCPIACGLVTHFTITTTEAPEQVYAPIVGVNAKTPMGARLKLQKSPAYQDMWTTTCTGSNGRGEPLQVATDGFACAGDNTVQSIVAPAWVKPREACCKGQCMAATEVVNNCAMEPKTLAEAAHLSALAIGKLKTKSGQEVQANVRPATKEEKVNETGLIATVEIHMSDGLKFKRGKGELTEEGANFLMELQDPMSMLMTMVLTAFGDTGDIRFLFCAHGVSGASGWNPFAKWSDLPTQRAKSIADALRAFLPEKADIGEPHGHYDSEDGWGGISGGMKGGNFGSILYKIFEADNPVQCKFEDLYEMRDRELARQARLEAEKAAAEMQKAADKLLNPAEHMPDVNPADDMPDGAEQPKQFWR